MSERKPLDTRYLDLKELKAEMDRQSFRFKKRWGQNFLLGEKLLDFITQSGEVGEKDLLLEVGGGPGCLTRVLLHSGAHVLGVEIDPILYEIGKNLLLKNTSKKTRKRLIWMNADFLEKKNKINPAVEEVLRQKMAFSKELGLKVIANLPYCIATPAIMNIMESPWPWDLMILMIQDEVADRFVAQPGTKAYGQVTVLASALGEIKKLKKVPPGAFWPKPEVDSAIIRIQPSPHAVLSKGLPYNELKSFTRSIFSHRRKTWLKSLRVSHKSMDLDNFIGTVREQGISTEMRAQDLGLEEIVRIALLYIQNNK